MIGREDALLETGLAEILATEGVAVATRGKYWGLFKRFENWWEKGNYAKEFGASRERRYDCIDETAILWYFTFERKWKGMSFCVLKALQNAMRHCLMMECGRDVFRVNREGESVRLWRVERFMRAMKREDASKEKKKKFALTKSVLTRMKPLFRKKKRDDRMMWAVLCVGVACLLRLSEVCVVKEESREAKLLRWGDMRVEETGSQSERGFLQLHDTKTKFYGYDMEVNFFRDGSETCPIGAVKGWLKKRERSSREGPLFVTKKGGALKFKTLDRKVRACLKELGYDMGKFRGWSMRRGGAMSLARAGVSDRVIRGMGRWRSWCYRMYLDLQMDEKELAARQVADAVEKERGENVNEMYDRIERWVLREEWVGRRRE